MAGGFCELFIFLRLGENLKQTLITNSLLSHPLQSLLLWSNQLILPELLKQHALQRGRVNKPPDYFNKPALIWQYKDDGLRLIFYSLCRLKIYVWCRPQNFVDIFFIWLQGNAALGRQYTVKNGYKRVSQLKIIITILDYRCESTLAWVVLGLKWTWSRWTVEGRPVVLSLSLLKFSLKQILMNFDFGHFPFFF